MRKHLAWYVADLPGSKELRPQIFSAETYAEVEDILRRFAELGAEAAPQTGRLAAFEIASCDPAALAAASVGPLGAVANVATAGQPPTDLGGGEARA
jgi:hypothetical protein